MTLLYCWGCVTMTRTPMSWGHCELMLSTTSITNQILLHDIIYERPLSCQRQSDTKEWSSLMEIFVVYFRLVKKKQNWNSIILRRTQFLFRLFNLAAIFFPLFKFWSQSLNNFPPSKHRKHSEKLREVDGLGFLVVFWFLFVCGTRNFSLFCYLFFWFTGQRAGKGKTIPRKKNKRRIVGAVINRDIMKTSCWCNYILSIGLEKIDIGFATFYRS